MSSRRIFIAGTDTGVGKTTVAVSILRELGRRGEKATGFKPIACGDREDAIKLAELSESNSVDVINPIWFQAPLAPLVAARLENRVVDRQRILEALKQLRADNDWVIIEGAGGWEVPTSADETMADLAVDFGASVLLVAANRLGVLNHAILTVRAIQERGLECGGIVLNLIEPADRESDPSIFSNRQTLQSIFPEIPVVEQGYQAGELDDSLLRRLLD